MEGLKNKKKIANSTKKEIAKKIASEKKKTTAKIKKNVRKAIADTKKKIRKRTSKIFSDARKKATKATTKALSATKKKLHKKGLAGDKKRKPISSFSNEEIINVLCYYHIYDEEAIFYAMEDFITPRIRRRGLLKYYKEELTESEKKDVLNELNDTYRK